MITGKTNQTETRDQDVFKLHYTISIGSSGAPTLPTNPGDVVVGQTIGHPSAGKYTFTVSNRNLGISLLDSSLHVTTNTDATRFDGEIAVNMTTGVCTARVYNSSGAATDPPSGSIISGIICMKKSNRRAST